MAVAMDLGNASSPYGSIHPNDKQDVGYRLALAGQAVAYGDLDVYYSGPIVSDVIISLYNSSTWYATVKYQHESVGKGGIQLRSKQGFEVMCVINGRHCYYNYKFYVHANKGPVKRTQHFKAISCNIVGRNVLATL